MISWKALRSICLLLLLAPIVHLAYLVSRDTVAMLDSSPEAWAGEIDAYARQDRANQLPEDPLVVIGGRRVKLWRGLDDLLAPQPVLMRGLGNATVDDLHHHYERLVGFYRPQSVVLLTGNSEFHLRASKSAAELFKDIVKLVALDEALQAAQRFYVITPLKTPLYPDDDAIVDQASALLATWGQSEPHVRVLDANALLRRADGRPNPAFFRADGVNLNEHGYLRLSMLLQKALDEDRAAGAGNAS